MPEVAPNKIGEYLILSTAIYCLAKSVNAPK